MKWERFCELGDELPEVTRTTWYGMPSLAVRGKSFTRLKEDGASVVFLLDDVEEQQLLIAARPDVYFITDHYRGHPSVLSRLTKLPVAECRLRLAQSWRRKAPKALVRQLDRDAGV
jgi:hypothetical protein